MENLDSKIRGIIAEIIHNNDVFDCDELRNLQELGMDSITFVSLVVSLEDAFDFEFPDDKLIMSEANTISGLKDIIVSTRQNNGEGGL